MIRKKPAPHLDSGVGTGFRARAFRALVQITEHLSGLAQPTARGRDLRGILAVLVVAVPFSIMRLSPALRGIDIARRQRISKVAIWPSRNIEKRSMSEPDGRDKVVGVGENTKLGHSLLVVGILPVAGEVGIGGVHPGDEHWGGPAKLQSEEFILFTPPPGVSSKDAWA